MCVLAVVVIESSCFQRADPLAFIRRLSATRKQNTSFQDITPHLALTPSGSGHRTGTAPLTGSGPRTSKTGASEDARRGGGGAASTRSSSNLIPLSCADITLDQRTPQEVHHSDGSVTKLYTGRIDGTDERVMVKLPPEEWTHGEISGATRVSTISFSRRLRAHILIVNIVDMQIDGMPRDVVVSKLYSEGSLSDWKNNPAMVAASPSMGLTSLRNTAIALEALHERRVVHCDVKPENILLDRDGSAVLGDFGSCAFIDEEVNTHTRFYSIAEYENDSAHVKMDWAGLVLTGLFLIDKPPTRDNGYVRFAPLQAEVESLADDRDEVSMFIREVFYGHLMQ